jgi:hypothetical protein
MKTAAKTTFIKSSQFLGSLHDFLPMAFGIERADDQAFEVECVWYRPSTTEDIVKHITLEMLIEAAAAQESIFDSHAIIRWLTKVYPREFTREQYDCVAHLDPMQLVCAKISSGMHKVPGIVPHGKVKSMNMRGDVTENQQWRKVPVPAAAMTDEPELQTAQ